MVRKVILSALLSVALCSQVTWAQVTTTQTNVPLASIFKTIYGPNGLKLDSETLLPDGSTHSAHFNSNFQSSFTQFTVALTSRLTDVPLPTPASGFTYTYDKEKGTFTRSTQSFGPILSERAETIGKNKLSFSFNVQRFSFDSIEGIDLSSVPAVFTHDDRDLGGGRLDLVTTNNAITANVTQATTFFNYGLTGWMDVSVAVPVVRTSLSLSSDATIQRIGTTDVRTHFFRDPSAPGGYGSEAIFKSSGTKSGIGDVVFRLKATAVKKGPAGLAVGVNVRAPSGDEQNLLGAGAAGVRPYAAFSYSLKRFAPHANIGYQWNGDSVLAGDVSTGTKAALPREVLYAIGTDVGINEYFSLAFDILGEDVLNSSRLVSSTFPAGGGSTAVFKDIQFAKQSFNMTNGAIGFKLNPGGRFLTTFNLLLKMNNAGLRDKVAPLFGIEYNF
jgi:hypothetical protein